MAAKLKQEMNRKRIGLGKPTFNAPNDEKRKIIGWWSAERRSKKMFSS